MKDKIKEENEVTFKGLFLPLTTKKAIVFIFIIGFIVFFNMLFNGFVWDDITYIQQNLDIHTFNLISIFTTNSSFNYGNFYRPIPMLYFSTLYSLFQNQPFFYHLIQLGMHIAVSCFLYLLFVKYFKKEIALFLSIIFLIHPINVESVSYISSSQSELYSLFGLSALLLSSFSNITKKMLILITVLLLLAILTKEIAIIYFILILIVRVIDKKGSIRTFIFLEAIILFVYSILRFGVAKIFFTVPLAFTVPISRASLGERLMQMPSIFFYYLKTFFYPKDLAILQNWLIKDVTFRNFYLPLLIDISVLLILIVIGFKLYKQSKNIFKKYVFFLLWFLGGMIFVLQIFPLDNTVADRWFYLPIIGLLGIMGVIFKNFSTKNKNVRVIILSLIIITICIFSVRTVLRNTDWIDGHNLYQHDIYISDDYYKEDGLAGYFMLKGDYVQAYIHQEKSVRLFPTYSNLTNLGIIYQKIGEYDKAKDTYYNALKYASNSQAIYSAYANLALLFIRQGNSNDAIPVIKNKLLKDFPNNAGLWMLLAIAEYKSNNLENALLAAQKAYAISPSQQSYFIYNQITKKAPAKDFDNLKWNLY
jgi:protein O-mannosyl-transferase